MDLRQSNIYIGQAQKSHYEETGESDFDIFNLLLVFFVNSVTDKLNSEIIPKLFMEVLKTG